jgi:hypothetical protein
MFKPRTGTVIAVGAAGALVLSVSASASLAQDSAAAGAPDVRISEFTNGGPSGGTDEYIEIANFGDETADLDGWSLYTCTTSGGRNGSPVVPLLSGVTLAPGETYLVAHASSPVADIADEPFLAGFGLPDTGTGAYLADDQRRLVDAVAIYAAATPSDCGLNHVPNVLDYRRGQSYQRVAISGSPDDFIVASRTPGGSEAPEPDPGVQPSDIKITELANGGPGGDSDDFVEFGNFGTQPVDVSDWSFYRCSSNGRRYASGHQVTLPAGTVIDPGQVLVAAHISAELPDGVDNVRYNTQLDPLGFGALIEDADGNVMDSVAVYETDGFHQQPTDSACTQGTALPNRLDFGFGESYQRFQGTADNAADFVRAPRSVGELTTPDPDDYPEDLGELPDADLEADQFEFAPVRVSEITHSGPAGHGDTFMELANYGDSPVSLADWSVHYCANDGRRQAEPMIPAIDDVKLAPGETFLAVREGSPLHQAGQYDAVYTVDLSGESEGTGLLKTVSYGLIVYDAEGDPVDSVGVNTSGTSAVTPYNACAKGIFLSNITDTELGESHQRFQATGTDAFDFTPAPRSPGEVPDDLRHPADLTDEELEPVDVEPRPRPLPLALVGPEPGTDGVGSEVDLRVTAEHTADEDMTVAFRGAERIRVHERATQVFTGVSDDAPLTGRRGDGEKRVPAGDVPLDGITDPLVVEAAEGFPYQRYQMLLDERVEGDEVEIVWTGRSAGRNELQLYAWNHHDAAWELLDAGGGADGEQITLVGRADVSTMVRDRLMDVLVQDGPATRERFPDAQSEPNLEFKNPTDYDFSLGFIADTQQMAEGFRNVYAATNRWLVTNQDARDIAYTVHTGDIIEKWTRQVDVEGRGREQFQFASDVVGLLENAGHPYGVIPGNHDNITGRSNELFNEYFPPSRYEGKPWWGDSWRPDDNLNHFDVVESDGAKFLMLYLGYFGGPCSWPQATEEAREWCADKSPQATIDWANHVIADHPDHNVVFATHNYITSAGDLTSPDTSRWNSIGYRYWNEVILPNENVFMVLSGHNQGVTLNIKRDVGGVEGRVVVEMMADYDGHIRDGRRGVGFLRLLQVDVDAKKMAVNSYSPWLEDHNAWEYDRFAESRYDDADDEFTLDIDINDVYHKRVETDLIGAFRPADEIGTVDAAADDDVTVTWSDLSPDTTYGWYTEARDASGVIARSPIWTFTTGG